MAKKRAEDSMPGPESGRQKNIFVLRGSDEYKQWMDGLAQHLGLPLTLTVTTSLSEKAQRSGYRNPPARY